VQACIEHELSLAEVRQYDDGSQPSMYDLKITYPDGEVAAVEITSATDEQQIRIRKSTRGRTGRWQEPSLAGGWVIRVSAPQVPKYFNKQLSGLLLTLEQTGQVAIRGDKSSSDPLTALAGDLGILEASQWRTAHPGSIYVMPEGPSLKRQNPSKYRRKSVTAPAARSPRRRQHRVSGHAGSPRTVAAAVARRPARLFDVYWIADPGQAEPPGAVCLGEADRGVPCAGSSKYL
jgi:hypothetical protein